MMTNYTALLHLVMGIFSLCTTLYYSVRYLKQYNLYAKRLGWFFFFLSAYTICVSLPFYIWPNDITFAIWGLVIGWVFVQLIILEGLTITITGIPHILPRLQNIMRWGLFFAGFFFLGLLIIDLPVPTLLPNGFVLWNLPPLIGFGLGGTAFIAGVFWSYLHYRTYKITAPYKRLTRAKLILLATDSVAWAVAAFIYVAINHIFAVSLAFVLMVLSLFATAVVMWFSGYLETP